MFVCVSVSGGYGLATSMRFSLLHCLRREPTEPSIRFDHPRSHSRASEISCLTINGTWELIGTVKVVIWATIGIFFFMVCGLLICFVPYEGFSDNDLKIFQIENKSRLGANWNRYSQVATWTTIVKFFLGKWNYRHVKDNQIENTSFFSFVDWYHMKLLVWQWFENILFLLCNLAIWKYSFSFV